MHLFGNVAPVAEIEALGVPVLEDAAQAAGSRGPAGRPGIARDGGDVQLLPVQEPRRLGDGGAVTTDDAEIAERVRMLRFHGSRDQTTWELVGYNSRLDALQAAFLRVLLPHLDDWAAGRARAAEHYRRGGPRRARAAPRADARGRSRPGTCT